MTKLSTSEETDIRERLEGALKTSVSPTQWDYLKTQGVLENYVGSPMDDERERWEEFARDADAELQRLRDWYERLREEEDEGYSRPESSSLRDREQYSGLVGETRGSERTAARMEALRAYDRLQSGTDAVTKRLAMYDTLLPRGGLDGTVAQWVYALQVELWVPAEDVKETYLDLQRALTEERARKADPRTIEVARFVWEQKYNHEGEDLSYLDLMKRWNESRSDDGRFNNWRTFRNTYIRGKEATLPRYEGSADLLQQEARKGYGKHLFETWASDVSGTF